MSAVSRARDARPGILHTIRSLRVDGVVKVLLRNLAHHDRDRFRHYVCSLRDEHELAGEYRASGFEPLFLGHHGPASMGRTVRRAKGLLRELDIDVVHSNRTADLALVGAAARAAGVAVVSSIHWLGRPSDHPEDAHLSWTRRRGEMMLTVALNRAFASRIVAVSGAVRQSYASLPGFPDDRVDVIYPGIDMHAVLDPDGARAQALRSALGLDGRGPVLLNVGRLHPVKGQLHLVSAMQRVRERLPHAVLLIAGGGELHEVLRQRIAEAGMENAIRLLGMRSDVDVLLGLCDVLVMASESEAAPLPLFEAMRAGRPIVATRVGGIAEIVDEGVNARLVPRADPDAMADAIIDIAAEPGRMARMGAAARQAGLDRYDIRASVAQIERLYDELLPPRS